MLQNILHTCKRYVINYHVEQNFLEKLIRASCIFSYLFKILYTFLFLNKKNKDDEDCLTFTTAAANLRSHVFSIELKSKFDVKCKF
jgi:hypothetical protein